MNEFVPDSPGCLVRSLSSHSHTISGIRFTDTPSMYALNWASSVSVREEKSSSSYFSSTSFFTIFSPLEPKNTPLMYTFCPIINLAVSLLRSPSRVALLPPQKTPPVTYTGGAAASIPVICSKVFSTWGRF